MELIQDLDAVLQDYLAAVQERYPNYFSMS